ncbi:hypothetical protein H131_01528 [Lysinibacillus sphaericus OT4b.31]|uniref:Uncharacterized protein n=1 Tax=Lysinibacillus sphaericus OT4b.31 TaxID=1285586 RepID=R7ZJ93_LYSSH|nr:hypothetical protein H131_01528 [Lysinibacillus sphaericus OT4b.31]
MFLLITCLKKEFCSGIDSREVYLLNFAFINVAKNGFISQVDVFIMRRLERLKQRRIERLSQ